MSTNLKHILIALMALTPLLSCTSQQIGPTITPDLCMRTDWFELGVHDGRSGRPANQIELHRARCPQASITSNAEQYEIGRNKGLVHYCSLEIGLEMGKASGIYQSVCPPHLEGLFIRGYQAGLELSKLEEENTRLEHEVQGLNQKLSATPTEQKASILSQIMLLKKKQTGNNEKMSSLERQVGTKTIF